MRGKVERYVKSLVEFFSHLTESERTRHYAYVYMVRVLSSFLGTVLRATEASYTAHLDQHNRLVIPQYPTITHTVYLYN